jgi:hypothetical protein
VRSPRERALGVLLAFFPTIASPVDRLPRQCNMLTAS